MAAVLLPRDVDPLLEAFVTLRPQRHSIIPILALRCPAPARYRLCLSRLAAVE